MYFNDNPELMLAMLLDMLQMIGRATFGNSAQSVAGAESWDSDTNSKAKVMVLCQDILKDYWITALFFPMVLESTLHRR